MKRARVAVFVSGGGTNLQALLDASMPAAEIVLVIASREDAYALTRAKRAGIAAIAIPEKGEAFEKRALEALRTYEVQVAVFAGFLRILSAAFIRTFAGPILNVHPALIPSFCGKGFYGMKVHEAVLARGVKVTGATVHLVNDVPDGGPILLQKAVDVLPTDTPETLQKRVMEQAEWVLLPQAVQMVCEQVCKEAEYAYGF